MRAVDTNVVVRLIAQDDSKQVIAAKDFIGGGAWISLVVIAEVAWVLSSTYARTAEQVATAVEMLLSHQYFVVQDPETVAAALEMFRKRHALGFSDCLILEIARRSGHLPLGTFDRDLAKVEGAERL